MSFLYPIFIYLMLPLVLVLFYFIIRGSKESFSGFSAEVLERLRHDSKSLSDTLRYSLFLVSFIFMIIALSQPVIKEGEIVVEAKSADILVGIDISDSMKAEDLYPNRLESAKTKAINLIKIAPHNRIGVLAFAQHDYIVSPLSFDHSSVAFLLSKVDTKHITEKGTHLDSMLKSAIAMLEHADTKNLLLFTDGGDSDDFSDEIQLAKENNLRLFIIGVGTLQGSPVRAEDGSFIKHNGNILISKLNENIQDLATKTGGVYIESVLGDADIKTMLKEIESITEKSTLKEETIPQYIQLFYYPLALALLFLLLAFASLPKQLAKTFVFIGLISLSVQEARAGLFDFVSLEEAKEAYVKEDYAKSASVYENFAMESSEALYNLGNSLYKAKDYERALKVYEKISTQDENFKTMALHNSGNAHVQLKQYEEALISYEQALSVKEDKETRENYEAVKKFLEEKKKEEEQEKKNQDKKENKDDKQDKDKKDKQDSDKKDGSDKKDDEQKSENKDEKKKDQKDKSDEKNKSDEKDNQKKDKSKKDEKSEKKDKSDEKDNAQKEEQSKEDKKAEEKLKEEQKSAKEEEGEVKGVTAKKMSDIEAKKWINMIKKSQKGHLYKMQNVEHEEDTNEKPW